MRASETDKIMDILLQKRGFLHGMFWICVITGYIIVQPAILQPEVLQSNTFRILVKFLLIILMCYINLYVMWANLVELNQRHSLYLALLFLLNLAMAFALLWLETYSPLRSDLKTGSTDWQRHQLYYFGTQFVSNFWFLGSTVALHTARKYIREKRQMARMQIEHLQTEVKYLTEKINPHFLFNALNTIYVQIDKRNQDARDTVSTFSSLLRYHLYECNEETVSLQKEFNYIRQYIELQKLRKGNRYSIRFSCPTPDKDQSIPPLLFIGFIENAFKFISNYSNRQNFLVAEFELRETTLTMLVSNSYQPEDQKACNTENSGMGLKNIRRRLALLFPDKHQLHIKDDKGIYTVHLIIELQ